ncbi:MAG TPA: polysaccharide deacetylase family sporulation protein PdaB [Desulfotomaculum sp.]|nr:polysaccharide deacetylase family sporulation protein PdaB [Desulfotomaculum sp.]
MRLFYLNLRTYRQVLLLTLCLFAISGLFTFAVLRQTADLPINAQGSDTPIIYRVKTDKKAVALTFDISWGTRTPGPVLDILKEENVQCTFFLSGPWVKKYPEIAKRIAAEGHEIASHGYRHINLSQLSEEAIKNEILKAHEIILSVTGRKPRFIRTPNGDWDAKVLQAAQEAGYTVIQWEVDSLDWKNPGVETIIRRVTTLVRPGSIVLLHASDSCQQTDKALPVVIRELREQGYELVTLSALLRYGPGVVE